MAPTVVTEPARDVPSDSVRASQVPPVARPRRGWHGSWLGRLAAFVVVGGIALALLGAAFGAAAATRNTPRPT